MSSCTSPNNKVETSSSGPLSEIESPIIEKDLCRLIIYKKDSQNLNNETWINVIKNEYGIEIIPYSQKMNNGIESIISAYNAELPALVYLFYNEFVDSFPEIKDKIVPLDYLLGSNETWRALPDKYKMNGTYEQTLWGIPLQYNEYGSSENVRLFQSAILESLGVTVPVNTSSFYEYLFLTNEYGLSDYLMHITKASPFYDMGDIFTSFGIKSDYHTTTLYSINYDYEEKRYTDTATTPGMFQALEYIKHLSSNGYIHVSDTSSFPTESFYQEKTATVINSLTQIIKNRKIDLEYSLGFINSTDNKIYVQQSKGMYVFVNQANDSSFCLSQMVNEFLKNDLTNKTAYIGDKKRYREIEDNIILYDGSIVDDAPYLIGNILITQKVISGKNTLSGNSIYSETELEEYSSLLHIYKLKAERWNFIPFTIEDFSLRTETEYTKIFQSYAEKIYTQNISIDDILENYVSTMKINGGYDFLENLNLLLNE